MADTILHSQIQKSSQDSPLKNPTGAFSPSLSNLIDLVLSQEEYHRAEMLRLKRLRGRLEARIQATLDEFSTLAEQAYTTDEGVQ